MNDSDKQYEQNGFPQKSCYSSRLGVPVPLAIFNCQIRSGADV